MKRWLFALCFIVIASPLYAFNSAIQAVVSSGKTCTPNTCAFTNSTIIQDMTVGVGGNQDLAALCSCTDGACVFTAGGTGCSIVSTDDLQADSASGTDGCIVYADNAAHGAYCAAAQSQQTVTISAAGCADSTATETGVLGIWNIGNGNANNTYVGMRFDASYPLAHSVCGVTFNMYSTGNISGASLTAKIWSITGGNLNTVLATSDAHAGGSWTATPVTFTFSTPYATSVNGSYGFTLECTSGCDASNYAAMSYSNEIKYAGYTIHWDGSKAVYDYQHVTTTMTVKAQ